MEFLNSIDFILVGLVICLLLEVVITGPSNIKPIRFLVGLFYAGFSIYLLWTPYWRPALLLLALGVVTSSITRSLNKKYNELLAAGVEADHPYIQNITANVKANLVMDQILSIMILGWILYLHIVNLGIAAA